MQLDDNQRAKLKAYAAEKGLDEAKLIAAAEASDESPGEGQQAQGEQKQNAGPPSSTEKPKLFMYLLPFVTVKEVRSIWLEIEDAFPGDSEVASEWASKHGGGGGATKPEDG